MISVLVLTLMSLAFLQCEIIPRFDMRDKDGIIFDPIVPRAGESMTAKCTVVQLTPGNRKSVSWRLHRQNDGKIFYLATNNDVFQFKNPIQRLWAHHELNSQDWYLHFDPLDRDDIGNLTCFLADTGEEEVSLTRYLDVHSEPIILESSTKDVEVDIGESFNLDCMAQGYPKPNISWIRADSKPLQGGIAKFNDQRLMLRNISMHDRGVYKCIATNLIGSGSEWTLKVSVRFPPSVKCQESVGQAPNFEVDAYMECYAHGYPAPRLSWYKEVDPNNPTALIPLTEKSFKYKFEATIPEPDVCTDCILARITVINVISGDYGTYVLRATSESSLGYMSEGRVRLYQTPECQQSITNPDNKGCRSPPKLN
ncbi:lachesin [Brachionus plicatilis]|uniref:Lachesin n=1 Tax=Brachionus plicatilis TaxID=10195 RepID=A0A3M7PY30_BRAPC|nr:lachesin [Brachionus plicatilis]